MRKLSNPSLVILSLLFILCMSISTKAQTSPERDIKVLGEIDPFEVTIYRDSNYINPIGKWKIQPGMRILKVPKLDNVPRSIHVGSKVGVIIFPNEDFCSTLNKAAGYKVNWGAYNTPTNFYLIPYFQFLSSNPAISYPAKVYQPCSLIIHRMDIQDILGVYLESGNNRGQFYPLPENANDSAIIYYNVLSGGPLKLGIIPTHQMYLWPPTSHPNQYDIQITVKSVQGRELKLPPPNNQSGEDFDLNKLGIYQISSLKLQYKGPLDEHAYLSLPPKKHRAPPAMAPHEIKVITTQKITQKKDMDTKRAMKPQTSSVIPTKPHFDLSDMDRPGNNYRNFDLPQPDPNLCLEACQKESRCKAFTYVKPGVQGRSARCWLKDAVPPEKPSDCCVSGVKQ